MTKLLEMALEAARALPEDAQDEIARALLAMTGNDGEPEAIPEEHRAAVLEGLAQADAGTFASEEELEAALRPFAR